MNTKNTATKIVSICYAELLGVDSTNRKQAIDNAIEHVEKVLGNFKTEICEQNKN